MCLYVSTHNCRYALMYIIIQAMKTRSTSMCWNVMILLIILLLLLISYLISSSDLIIASYDKCFKIYHLYFYALKSLAIRANKTVPPYDGPKIYKFSFF